jgi:hypothetical protein
LNGDGFMRGHLPGMQDRSFHVTLPFPGALWCCIAASLLPMPSRFREDQEGRGALGPLYIT